jgi:hypothetical protein
MTTFFTDVISGVTGWHFIDSASEWDVTPFREKTFGVKKTCFSTSFAPARLIWTQYFRLSLSNAVA